MLSFRSGCTSRFSLTAPFTAERGRLQLNRELMAVVEEDMTDPIKPVLMDAIGRSLESKELVNTGEASFNLTAAPKGIYLLEIN